jgi:hypothetical protein
MKSILLLRLYSALYSCYLFFFLNFKFGIIYLNYYFNNNRITYKDDSYIFFIYLIISLYCLAITIYLINIKIYSINSLNLKILYILYILYTY